ncbi:MAG: aspartate aminotransferase family protein [Alphaproteobacteria bacterium]|nr:aspartate aminotransferase family protein [Alphaproteobacteria bacterium]
MKRYDNIVPSLFLDFMQMQEFAKDPLVFTEGAGIRLKTTDGHAFIDALSGVFTASVGHGNRAVIAAIGAQLEHLAFAPPLHGTNPAALQLTELLLRVAPPGVGAAKLLSGGSEATEAAMKLARQFHRQTGAPHRYKIIGRYGGYHGGTMGALSAGGGRERKAPFEPLGTGFLHVHPPYCYRCPFDQLYPSCGRTCAELIGRTIEAEDPQTVAAVIVEPISISSAGFVVPPPDYLSRLRQICDQSGVLMIYDEIITGFGRLGTMFASEHFGAVPDITCCGKGMSGGYAPLAAILIRDRVARAFYGEADDNVQFHHGHTFGGNPIACAAGVAVLTEILSHDLVGNARARGEHLRARLEEMAARYDLIGDVRGAGLLQGIELVRDRATRAPFPRGARPGKAIERAARERGLLLRCGDNFAAFAPPLTVSDAEIDEMTALLDASIAAAQRELAA